MKNQKKDINDSKPKESPQTIAQYWAGVDIAINRLATLLGVLSTTITFFLLVIISPDIASSPWFWPGVMAMSVIQIIIAAIVLQYVSRPLRDILAAISTAKGEKASYFAPPNLSTKRYKNTGFSDAINFIYGTSRAGSSTDTSIIDMQELINARGIIDSLERLGVDIVLLDASMNILFHTPEAPVKTTSDDKKETSLLFDGKDSLNMWIEECHTKAVNAEKTWERVPDKIAGTEDRRLYDIYANYKKGSASETVVTFINKTNTYEKDETELDFISFAAHELRGPITVVRGYIDVLHDELNDKLVDDQPGLFLRLEVSANRLSGYINNILNTSRYDRRHLRARLSKTTLSSVYSIIEDDMNLRTSLQNKLLEASIPNSLPFIAADRTSLSEVLTNLIDNAIKYSHEGGLISVSAKQVDKFVEIKVKDRGIGMPSNVLENVFKKFYRSHRSRETVAGTGIGLYISKAIIEAHNGHIQVKSEEGKGSEFIVSIPTFDSIKNKDLMSPEDKGVVSEGGGWIKNHGLYRE